MEAIVTLPTEQPKLITPPEATPAKGEKPPADPFGDFIKSGGEPAKPKEQPVKAETAPSVDDEPPAEIKSEKGKSDWKTFKTKLAEAEKIKAELETKYTTETGTLKQQKEELERQFNELKSKADPEAFERLKGEREELSLRLRVKDVTSDPEWQKAFVAPVNEAMKEALAMVPAELQKKAEWMLKQPDSQERTEALEEMIGGLRPLAQSRFANALSKIDGTRARADALLADTPKLVERYEASRRVHGEAQANQAKVDKNRTFEAVASKFTALPYAETPEESAKVAQEAVAQARTYFESGDPEATARMANWAVFGEKAFPRITHLETALKNANDMIKQLQGSKPGNGSVNQGSKNSNASKDPFADGFKTQ